jgi:hypothetical protein
MAQSGGARRGPDGVAKRGARRGQTECLTGPNGVPDGGQTGCPTGGQTGPDGCHVIGHVIFEYHVTRLGWQEVILLPTLINQR